MSGKNSCYGHNALVTLVTVSRMWEMSPCLPNVLYCELYCIYDVKLHCITTTLNPFLSSMLQCLSLLHNYVTFLTRTSSHFFFFIKGMTFPVQLQLSLLFDRRQLLFPLNPGIAFFLSHVPPVFSSTIASSNFSLSSKAWPFDFTISFLYI